MKILLALVLALTTTGCAFKHRINVWAAGVNQRIVDKCMAKEHDAAKCRQLTYPSCEQGWNGQECKP